MQMSAAVQAGGLNPMQPDNTLSGAQLMPAASQCPVQIFYPFLQVPIQLPPWGLFHQQALLVPPTQLNEQTSTLPQQAAAQASKTSDGNPFQQQAPQA
jgi:hypothetical protein